MSRTRTRTVRILNGSILIVYVVCTAFFFFTAHDTRSNSCNGEKPVIPMCRQLDEISACNAIKERDMKCIHADEYNRKF